MPQPITRDSVSGEAMFILKNLKENNRLGRSNKLADVKSALEPAVSLEFDTYFFFLRKFHYIAMDREAQLKLTDQGERVVDGDYSDKFSSEVGDFFADQFLAPDEKTQAHLNLTPQTAEELIPAPPADVLFEESADSARAVPPPPPVQSRSRRGGQDEPLGPPFPLPSNLPAPPAQPFIPPVPPIQLSTPAPPAALAPAGPKWTEIDLRYVKFDPLGSGPLGTVFKGRHNALGLDICVKELKDIFGYFSFLQRGEVVKRLKRELCAQAQVRHPGVVAILDQNTEVARPYFAMELLKGSLKEKLEAGGGKGIPVPLAIRYFLQMSYAMRAAHAGGLTHHNLKPENILFDQLGNAKLGDFGLSRVIEVDQAKGMPQVFVGTGGMGYMAPELISRSKDVGQASDVYAVGILLYEMLTGQIPGRRSPLPSEVNSEVPSKLDPIFDKMTQDRKEARYPDFDSMLEDFYGAFSDGEYLKKGDLVLWSEVAKA
ncbi:MAG TPA: serine/threonine-protein kinase [Myxococcaceae bacterium]|nr:serine/threonine-protein kinase [Myxococcaceae bacterium]